VQLLQHYQIDQLFTLIVGSNLDGTMSDKSEIIANILERLPDINTSNTVMIGDRIFYIKGAKKNNLDCIGVTYGYGSVEELTDANATYIADLVEQLGQILGVY
jgi:phosphoglycolate phosphatase